jgi:hypothetical protein
MFLIFLAKQTQAQSRSLIGQDSGAGAIDRQRIQHGIRVWPNVDLG